MGGIANATTSMNVRVSMHKQAPSGIVTATTGMNVRVSMHK